MEFYKSEKCRLSQEQGEMWFEYNPTDSNLVPDECVTYVEGSSHILINLPNESYFCGKFWKIFESFWAWAFTAEKEIGVNKNGNSLNLFEPSSSVKKPKKCYYKNKRHPIIFQQLTIIQYYTHAGTQYQYLQYKTNLRAEQEFISSEYACSFNDASTCHTDY